MLTDVAVVQIKVMLTDEDAYVAVVQIKVMLTDELFKDEQKL